MPGRYVKKKIELKKSTRKTQTTEETQKKTQRSVDENGLPRKRPGRRGGKG